MIWSGSFYASDPNHHLLVISQLTISIKMWIWQTLNCQADELSPFHCAVGGTGVGQVLLAKSH